MARPAVDISMIGDKKLELMLKKIPDIAQRRVVTSAVSKTAKAVHSLTIQAVSGNPVGVQTGKRLTAMIASKPKKQRRTTAVVYYIDIPDRASAGVAKDAKWFPPIHVEYGYVGEHGNTVPPHSYLRKPVDEHESALLADMGKDIRKGIIRNMKRLAKK